MPLEASPIPAGFTQCLISTHRPVVRCDDQKPDNRQADSFEATHLKVFAGAGSDGDRQRHAVMVHC